MPPLSVLHLDSFPDYRGGQRQLEYLAIGQHEGGLRVEVFARNPRLRRQLERLGRAVRPFRPESPASILALRRRLAQGLTVLHVHDARSQGLAAAFCPRTTRLVVHRRVDDPPADRALTRWKYSRGTVICVSHAVARVLATWGVPPSRLRVVHSAVDVPTLPRRPDPASPLRLLSVGALVDHKGHAELIEALRRLRRPAALTIAGTGPLGPALRKAASSLPPTVCVDFVEQPSPALFSSHDLLVHPSRTEGLGTAVLDAMAHAVPILTTTAGGLPELHAEGEGGSPPALVPPADPSALADALERWSCAAEERPEVLHEWGRAGRLRALSGFTREAMVAAVAAVYAERPAVEPSRRGPRPPGRQTVGRR